MPSGPSDGNVMSKSARWVTCRTLPAPTSYAQMLLRSFAPFAVVVYFDLIDSGAGKFANTDARFNKNSAVSSVSGKRGTGVKEH